MSETYAVPLVLLPGMGCSSSLWEEVLPRVRAAAPHLKIRTPRLRGRSLDECVEALLDVLPPRFALGGLSLGGIVAMALARRAPERITGLCLMSTNPQAPTEEQRHGWAAQRRRLVEGAHARDLQRDLLPVLLSRGTESPHRASVLSMAEAIGDQAFDAQLAMQATRQDERPGLSSISVPTLVVAADLDALCPPAWHADMAGRIAGSHLVRISDAGHLSPIEAPLAVADAIISWGHESCGIPVQR